MQWAALVCRSRYSCRLQRRRYARHKLGESCCWSVRNDVRVVGGSGGGAWAERRGRRRLSWGARLLADAGPGDGGVAAEAIAGAGAGIEYAGEGVEDAATVAAGGSGGVAKGIGRGKITTGGDERAGEQRCGGASFAGEHSADSAGVDINASVNRSTNCKTGRKPTVGGSEGRGAEPDESGEFIEIPGAIVGDGVVQHVGEPRDGGQSGFCAIGDAARAAVFLRILRGIAAAITNWIAGIWTDDCRSEDERGYSIRFCWRFPRGPEWSDIWDHEATNRHGAV